MASFSGMTFSRAAATFFPAGHALKIGLIDLSGRAAFVRLMLFVYAILMGGCMAGPDYKAPSIDLAPYHNASVQTGPTETAPTLDEWWKGFNDPVLIHIVRRALDQNLDLAASLGRIRQARAVANEAGAALLPSIDADAGVTDLHQSLESPLGVIGKHLPGYRRDHRLYDAGIGASWEIDLFGGPQRGVQAATAEAQAAEADHLGMRISVTADSADAYFQIRGDQARLKLAQDQVTTDEALLNLVHRRVTAGAATDREEAEAEALLFHARGTIAPLRTALEAQLNRLDVLMGAQPGTFAGELSMPTEVAPIEVASVPDITSGQTPGDLLRRRPDIIAAERRLAASNAAIGIATAEYYPKLSLSGLLGFESLSPGHLFSAATFQPQAVAGLQWRLFDFGKVDAEVAQAKGANAEALAHYRQSILHAVEDVENAFTDYAELQAESQELDHEIDALKRARDRSQEAYKAGAIDLTDVLDTDRELLTAQDSLARTRADRARAAVATFRSLGGGW